MLTQEAACDVGHSQAHAAVDVAPQHRRLELCSVSGP